MRFDIKSCSFNTAIKRQATESVCMKPDYFISLYKILINAVQSEFPHK